MIVYKDVFSISAVLALFIYIFQAFLLLFQALVNVSHLKIGIAERRGPPVRFSPVSFPAASNWLNRDRRLAWFLHGAAGRISIL